MQLTDPVAEAAMDCETSDSGSQSQDDGPDDASLDEMQAAEAAVVAEPENYEAHAAVRSAALVLDCTDAAPVFTEWSIECFLLSAAVDRHRLNQLPVEVMWYLCSSLPCCASTR